MGWTVSTFAIVVLSGAALAVVVGLATLRKRPDPMAWPLAVLMFAVAAWAIPHAVSFGYTDLARVAFWHRARYPGTVIAPVAYFVFALRYADYGEYLSRRTYAALGAIPAATIVLVWTNPHHGLFWRSIDTVRVSGASILLTEVGPWYWINILYLYLLVIASLILLADVAIRSGPGYRTQAGLLYCAGLVPFVVNLAVNFGIGPSPKVDITTTALAVTGLIFALTLFHFDLVDVRPIARSRLFEEIDDGVLVIGPNERIRDFNSTAARAFESLSVNRPAEEVLPADVAADGGELAVETDRGRRLFRTRSTGVVDGRGRETGRIIYMNDMTELIKREQRISVLNRVLRHNIRNELNVASGHLDLLAEDACPGRLDDVEKVRDSTQRVLELARKARYLEQLLQGDGTDQTVSVAAVAERVVADARDRFPHADVEFEAGRGAATPRGRDVGEETAEAPSTRVRVVDESIFEVALTELVENAAVHSDRERPGVTVGVDRSGDRVTVRVADDGPGVPGEERRALNSRTETDLEHGSGLGLWLVKWTASLSAGDLSFSTRDPRGTVVSLSLPASGE